MPGYNLSSRYIRPNKKDSCVQVLEAKKIRVGMSKNIFIWDIFFITHVQKLKQKTGFWRSAFF